MRTGEKYVALDLGAESGRVILGSLNEGLLEIQEMHRFSNHPVQVVHSLYWDVLHIWSEIKDSLAHIYANYGTDLAGIGIDSWALDFGLFDSHGEMIGMPHCYRDTRTEGILEVLKNLISEWDLYQRTGLPYISVSTLCQLLALRQVNRPMLETAQHLLLIPNLFTYWLCGRWVAETTIAGNTQFFSLPERNWDLPLLEQLSVPSHFLPEIVPSATILGELLPSIREEVGLGPIPVIATACHDTAAAVASIPCLDTEFTFISSGTWSVIGTEREKPILSREAIQRQFMNEMGACGKIFFAHNSIGLWSAQECRREWVRAGQDWSYVQLTEMASEATPFSAILNPDAASFFRPGNMAAKINEFCQKTGQPPIETPGEVFRALLEGLALRYRKAVEDLDSLTGHATPAIYLVGGGSRNRLLCQFTADALGCPVIAGPAEATASGTILLQALAHGRLGSLQDLRQVIRNSIKLIEYEPHPSVQWEDAYARFNTFEPTLL